nr:exonuclease domain-containing protein [Pseudalkalibacillus caeni]
MNNMIQFLKQLSGNRGANIYSSTSQTDPKQIAFMRQIERERKKEQVLDIPLTELKIVVFDIETTGFSPDQGDRILSIGAIKMKGSKLLEDDTFYSLVYSEQSPSLKVQTLTGITLDQLNEAPKIEEVFKAFNQFVQASPLVAHHSNHEKKFMSYFSWTTLRKGFNRRLIDTSFLTQIVNPSLNFVTLDECCSHFGIPISQRHHALGDAIMTAKLWGENVQAVQERGFRTLRDVYTHLARK